MDRFWTKSSTVRCADFVRMFTAHAPNFLPSFLKRLLKKNPPIVWNYQKIIVPLPSLFIVYEKNDENDDSQMAATAAGLLSAALHYRGCSSASVRLHTVALPRQRDNRPPGIFSDAKGTRLHCRKPEITTQHRTENNPLGAFAARAAYRRQTRFSATLTIRKRCTFSFRVWGC